MVEFWHFFILIVNEITWHVPILENFRWKWAIILLFARSQQHQRMDVVDLLEIHENHEQFSSNSTNHLWILLLDEGKFSCEMLFSSNKILVSLTCLLCVTYRTIKITFYFHKKIPSLPWNQTTFVGYFCEICFGNAAILTYMIANGAVLLLFMSMCIHHRAFFKMFKQFIYETKRHDNKRFLCKLIQLNISAKE